MSFINFKSHLNVALDENEPTYNRMWAFRSCCYSVCSLVKVIDTNELTDLISNKIEAKAEKKFNRILLLSKFKEACNLLVIFRKHMHLHKYRYDMERRILKRTKKRFPVKKPFAKESVLHSFNSIVIK